MLDINKLLNYNKGVDIEICLHPFFNIEEDELNGISTIVFTIWWYEGIEK